MSQITSNSNVHNLIATQMWSFFSIPYLAIKSYKLTVHCQEIETWFLDIFLFLFATPPHATYLKPQGFSPPKSLSNLSPSQHLQSTIIKVQLPSSLTWISSITSHYLHTWGPHVIHLHQSESFSSFLSIASNNSHTVILIPCIDQFPPRVPGNLISPLFCVNPHLYLLTIWLHFRESMGVAYQRYSRQLTLYLACTLW